MIVPAHHSHQILCYSTEQLLEWKLNSLLSHRHTVTEGQGEYGGNLSFYLAVMWWHWHLSISSCHCCPNLELKNYHNLICSLDQVVTLFLPLWMKGSRKVLNFWVIGHVHTSPGSFYTSTKIIPHSASVHTQGRWDWHDFCDRAKLCCAYL